MLEAQTWPQAPQFVGSFVVLTHVPPQFVFPSAGHGLLQPPPVQAGIASEQTWPQAPQFIGSVMRFEHVPLQFVFPSAGHGS